MTRLLLAASVLALAACQQPAPKADAGTARAGPSLVQVSEAWCRPTPNGAKAGACYATLKAEGGEFRLAGVSTPAAGMSMIHQMSTEGGVMSMSEMTDGLRVAAGQTVVLAPGGTHLMLMDLKAPLVAGETVTLNLTFDGGPVVEVPAIVRQP